MKQLLILLLFIPALAFSQQIKPISGVPHEIREAGNVTFVTQLHYNGPERVFPVSGQTVVYKGEASYADIVASGVVREWTPIYLNPVSWYDFTDLTTLTIDESNLISAIQDKSLNKNNGTASDNLRPLYVENQINGLGAAQFYHNSELNTITTSKDTLGQNATIFIVSSSYSSMNTIVGTSTNESILAHDIYMGLRMNGKVLGGSMYYDYHYYINDSDQYSYYTLISDNGETSYYERKNLRGYFDSSNDAFPNIYIKDIGGFAGYPNNKYIAEIIYYDKVLSLDELSLIHNYIEKKYNLLSFPTSPTNRITFVGNSMTASYIYPQYVYDSLNIDNSWIPTRLAAGGRRTDQLYPSATQNAFLLNQKTQVPIEGNDIVLIWEGTNDLYSGTSATDAESHLNTLCTYFKNANYKVIIMTILPRTEAGGFTEAKRDSCNTLIRTNYASYADAIADVGADELMGNEGDNENDTYYADPVHPSQAGYERLCDEWILPAINSLLE